MSGRVEFQRKLYTVLNGAGLRVYDQAPQDTDGASLATWPYVEIGHIPVNEFDTNTELGFDLTARIHTYSRSGGSLECLTIQGQIYDVLHNTVPTVTGHRTILILREMSDCTRLPDGSYHGVCEYRALLETT